MKKARVNVDPESSISNTTCEVCGWDTHSVFSIVVHSLSEVIHRRNGAPRWLVQVHFHVISYSKQAVIQPPLSTIPSPSYNSRTSILHHFLVQTPSSNSCVHQHPPILPPSFIFRKMPPRKGTNSFLSHITHSKTNHN
jgi:hypothetical protein